MNKKTDDLMNTLISKRDLMSYMKENKEEMISVSLADCIAKLLDSHGVKPSEVIERGELTKSYFYQILNGEKKNPARDKLIQICFGIGLSLDESQQLLKYSGAGALYPRNKRDSAIIFALSSGYDLIRCNELLVEIDGKLLCSDE